MSVTITHSFSHWFIGLPFIKRFALCYRTVILSCPVLSCPVLSVCLSVAFVHCGQTVGWIKMKLGRSRPWTQCVRWGLSFPSPKGAQPANFRPISVRPNGCMDQDVTWYRGRPRPRQLFVRWGPPFPPTESIRITNEYILKPVQNCIS